MKKGNVYVTAAEAAAIHNVTPRTIRALASRGKIRYHTVKGPAGTWVRRLRFSDVLKLKPVPRNVGYRAFDREAARVPRGVTCPAADW